LLAHFWQAVLIGVKPMLHLHTILLLPGLAGVGALLSGQVWHAPSDTNWGAGQITTVDGVKLMGVLVTVTLLGGGTVTRAPAVASCDVVGTVTNAPPVPANVNGAPGTGVTVTLAVH
jgi:hypothetical protein